MLASVLPCFASVTVDSYSVDYPLFELSVEINKHDDRDEYKAYVFIRRRSAFDETDFDSATLSISYGTYTKTVTYTKNELSELKQYYTLFSTGYSSTDSSEKPLLTCDVNYPTVPDVPVDPLPPVSDWSARLSGAFGQVLNWLKFIVGKFSDYPLFLSFVLLPLLLSVTLRLLFSLLGVRL